MYKSANTLFHFTSSAENLIGILENGFYPRFCLEEKITNLDFDIAIPMVCFCDIPLSEVSQHMSFYGNYGLGMKKEWALKKGMNPVIYLSSASSLAKHLDNILNTSLNVGIMLEKGKIEKSEIVKISGFVDVVEVKSFAKPISGKMYRSNKFISKYFYNEREWRYVL